MIIITGIGRSGTSLIAEYCMRLGLHMGNIKWNPAYDAGNEHPAVLEINKEMLRLIEGKNPDADFARFAKAVKHLDARAVKDPMFVAHSRIIRLWKSMRPDISVIYMHRDFRAIAASQMRHPTMYAPVYRCFPELMAVKEREFLQSCHDCALPAAVLTFPDILNDFQQVYHTIQSFTNVKIDKARAMQTWAALADRRKVHVK